MIYNFYKNFRVRDYLKCGEDSVPQRECIDCSLGTNPFLENNVIEKHLVNGIGSTNEYPTNGYSNLKIELLKFWNNKLNINLNTSNISFGAGTMGIIRNISEFLINENTYVLGYSPQFPRLISEVELKKGNYEYYKLKKENNYKFEADEFVKHIDSKYNMIITDNPNNPTGQVINVLDIEKIVKEANKYDITVVIDESYGEFMPLENSAIKLVSKYDNIAVLRSASKFWGLPNHRIGYVFASEEFIKVYDMVSIPFSFSDISANVFASMLKDYDLLKETSDKVKIAKRKIMDSLNKENYLYTDENTPIFAIKSNKYTDLTLELEKNGMLVEPCSEYFELDSTYARVRLNEKVEDIIKILNDIL